jgi:hypothetical protein
VIQLIGFLLCVYMFIRGLDIRSRVEDRKSEKAKSQANSAASIAVLASIIFFILFVFQGNSMPSTPSSL